jgi:GR25 family glycosyltransferase involved in LPS biosynthesis
MKQKDQRMENIKTQQRKINATLNVFDAIIGEDIDMNDVPNQIIADDFKEDSKHRKRQIGCFLSHYYILKLIESNGNPDGYTVIFEDDFNIVVDGFEEKLKSTLESMSPHEFDMLYIETLSNNMGEPFVKNVCKIDMDADFYGTQAYIVKNASIDKLLDATWTIDMAIDNKYDLAIRSKKIKAYTFCQFLTKSDDLETTLY